MGGSPSCESVVKVKPHVRTRRTMVTALRRPKSEEFGNENRVLTSAMLVGDTETECDLRNDVRKLQINTSGAAGWTNKRNALPKTKECLQE